MAGLIIAHLPGGAGISFEVVRQRDNRRAPPVEIASPYDFPVRDRPNDNLMSQLGWYLERFLEYPFPPRTKQAANVEEALESWGRQAFSALFDSGSARDWMTDAKRAKALQLQISADDPGVLSWPWEALYDPEAGVLAHRAQMERRLNQNLPDPLPLSERLPKERINILLLTARPYEQDLHFRSISRPLVDLIQKQRLPAQVNLLRPPTFDQLRKHLAEHPHFYHILHFDGHGDYGREASLSAEHPRGPEGRLVFETQDGKPDPIAAGELSDLLHEHAVPIVVLNACQSAMIDVHARDPFASVAAALLRSGIRSVVAMAYSLYVRAAQEFLPPFYSELFHSGNLPEAVRRGRTELRAHPRRSGLAAEVRLKDWIVPVIYQQGEELDLSFGARMSEQAGSVGQEAHLPEAAKLDTQYDFTGRDGALLELERAMRRKPAAILIHGLAGVGKTTLARAFVRWLHDTGGLGQGCFWFGFNEIRSAAHVFNEIGRALFGPRFGLEGIDASIDVLVKVFSEQPFVIVWDNFESICGLREAGIEPMLSSEDQSILRGFLQKLRGAPTKVLVTSRGEEPWLGPQNCFKLALSGLRHEEVWEYAAQILDDLGLRVDRRDSALADLLEWLGGHPLAMQAVLLQLQKHTIPELRAALEQNVGNFSGLDNENQRRLYASLDILRQSLPEELRPLLVPMSLHEKFVDAEFLAQMAQEVDQGFSRARINRFVSALTPAGLLAERASAIYEIHPLLPNFLRSEVLSKSASEQVEKWARAFVNVMTLAAYTAARLEVHEQRNPFAIHQANVHSALVHAEKLGMHMEFVALTESLALYSFNQRNFVRAQQIYVRLAQHCAARHDEMRAGITYHQLGLIAVEQRDFAAAERWTLKSLQIKEKLGDEEGTASTYHQLGMIAQEQRDFAAAERWYLKSLQIKEKFDDQHEAASTYHQLGMIAQEQSDFAAAERWYLKSLQITEKVGDQHGAAGTYHQLGINAAEQRDFAAAERWYLKSLQITEKLANEYGAALTYHQLGKVAQEKDELASAEHWYLKSLQIKEKLGDQHSAAPTYHQLGMLAAKQRDFAAAERWYLKSLQIKEKLGDQHSAATTYEQLGTDAAIQKQFVQAGQWFLKALDGYWNDPSGIQTSLNNFVYCLRRAPPHDQLRLREMWKAAGLPPFPDE